MPDTLLLSRTGSQRVRYGSGHHYGMTTQHGEKAHDPGQALEDRRAFDEAHIRIRGDGRQLVIDTGEEPEADDLDVHPQRESGGDLETDAPTPTPQGDEQRITGFSADSRRRLRRKMYAIRRDADGVFLTLTYHQTNPTCKEAKSHLDAFWKRLTRWLDEEDVGRISCIWKMEPQRRGVPHFHLVVYGPQFIPARKVSRLWHEVTGEPDHRHRKAGVDVERAVNEDGKLTAYLGKYMAETYDEWPNEDTTYTGRWWGVKGRDHVPWAPWDNAKVYLDQNEAKRLIRQLLDEWGIDIPSGVIPPSLCICTRGDPHDWIDEHLFAEASG